MRSSLQAGVLLLLLTTALAGCLADDDDEAPAPGWTYEQHTLPDAVAGFQHVAGVEVGVEGLWVENGLAYLSGQEGLRIVDVRDPAAPEVLSADVEGTQGSRDIELVHHENGRIYALMAHDASHVSLTDVTDPTRPRPMDPIPIPGNSHNIAVVPGTMVAYVSYGTAFWLGPGAYTIIDLADPLAPTAAGVAFPAIATTAGGVPKAITATNCHDVKFAADQPLAACPAVTETIIFDVSDPLAPVVVQVIHWPLTQLHHGAWIIENSTMLVIGDEIAGAATNAPGCLSQANPYAQLWFFDISDLRVPTPLGFFAVDDIGIVDYGLELCTTHFGTAIESHDLFVLGWYVAGTVLIDYSNPRLPVQVDQFRPEGDVDVWDAFYWNGHVYVGDTLRGLDILQLN